MCAAFRTGYHEIGNLFNHGNIRAEIIITISKFL